MNLPATLATLTALRQGGTASGKALHKPVLLLALLEAMDAGAGPEIPIDGVLKQRFDALWKLLVNDKPGTFFMPVYHLPTEGFWEVMTAGNQRARKEYSSLKGAAADGLWSRFTGDLAEVLTDPEGRAVARMVLLKHYFKGKELLFEAAYGSIDAVLVQEIAVHPYEKDSRFVHTVRVREYQGFVRYWRFRQDVLGMYRFTCCMTGLKAEFFGNYPLLDAAHIEQHAFSGLDNPTNGLALCKNMHAAFDNGMVSISDDYRILVSDKVKESASAHNLASLVGQKILLPTNEMLHPSPERLAWHRERWGL